MDTRTKIIDLATALGLRQDRRRLAVAAGAFDVLQAGHGRFLEGLRAEARTLLVVVWSDASLERPVLTEGSRAQLVAALAAVDHVVVAGRDDWKTLVERLRPERVEQDVPEERNIIEDVLERHR